MCGDDLCGRDLRLPDKPEQQVKPARPLSHSSDALTQFYQVALFNIERVVVPIGAEKGIVMLHDNKLTVTD